ncbi:MAG TPA: DNA-formamidopyrimidine glycosylase family protein [Solirubrobacteraceae bacterium]|nr:DNA-formamidopyrimidine glycosylase family protein [Solirubrobacteraceae bacterium]
MPEGDTIAWAANRIRPVLEGVVPESIETPQPRHALDRWSARLEGRAVTEVSTHGKHLFLHFDGGLVLHSHLGMTGAWGVYAPRRQARRSRSRAWIVMRSRGHEVIEFDGPLLELITAGRVRFDQRLAALGPDVLAEAFDTASFLGRLRSDDQTRTIGDALLDQRNVAGIGNIWKAEGCWEAAVDPWRRVSEMSDAEAVAIIKAMRPRMTVSAQEGPRTIKARVYGMSGRPCPRCGTKIVARGQGDANRTTYWCPGCQR